MIVHKSSAIQMYLYYVYELISIIYKLKLSYITYSNNYIDCLIWDVQVNYNVYEL